MEVLISTQTMIVFHNLTKQLLSLKQMSGMSIAGTLLFIVDTTVEYISVTFI